MEGLPSIAAEKLKSQLHGMVDSFAEEMVGIVNQARDGYLIDDSEELVRIAGKEFLRRAYEATLQQKIDASEASFPPSGDCGGGSGDATAGEEASA